MGVQGLANYQLVTGTVTAPYPPDSLLLSHVAIFVALIVCHKLILMCLIFIDQGTHKNLFPSSKVTHEMVWVYSASEPNQC